MKAHTKHLLVDQKVEQSPASVVVELTDAELEVIVGGGIGTSAEPQPFSTNAQTLNHNETLVTEETVDSSSMLVEIEELTDAELEAIAGGISCPTHECGVNHNETMVIATEMVF